MGVTLIEVDTNASYWQRAVGDDFTLGGNYVGVPRLIVSKGLRTMSIAGSYARLSDTGIEIWGGALDVPLIRGGVTTPTLALRGTYATLRGVSVYELDTYGLEVFLGKGFGPLTPYGAVGRMRSEARAVIFPEVSLTDTSDIDRYTVGLRISLAIPKIVVEATQAEERIYSAKISFGF